MPDPVPVRANGEVLDISHIKGNASPLVKRTLGDLSAVFMSERPKGATPMFGEAIQKRLKVTEISINPKPEDEKKKEAKLVVEVDVTEDMLNGGGSIHGGCSAFLVDLCTAIALSALSLETKGELYPCISQSINLIYHSPAGLGDKLRLFNTTLTLGARVHSARTEIWNVTHHRLVVSGTHIIMVPSPPKVKL